MEKKVTGRVLLLDDQQNWLRTIGRILQKEGHEVVTTKSVSEAVTALSNSRFEVAVLDLRLVDDDVNNFEGISVLRFIEEQGIPTRAVILTGYPTEEVRRKACDVYGADAFLLKFPETGFDVQSFKRQIVDLIQKSQMAKVE